MGKASSVMICAAAALAAWASQPAVSHAAAVTVEMRRLTAEGVDGSVGTLTLRDRDPTGGLLIQPALHGLPPGQHGFHVHERPTCAPGSENGRVVPGGAAGEHLDPERTGRHAGPYMNGHLGDLPAIWVGPDGEARTPVFAPRLSVETVRGHALILHEHGDNYAERPEPLGGGGGRLACAVVE